MTSPNAGFAVRLLAWFDDHGRHDLPWQHPRTPYRVWVSEIMLQQTQVQTVVGYFDRFIARFPDVPALAAASEDEVLALWSGLGYYSRGRNLRAAAQRCVEAHGGALPETLDALCALPGIGRSTAAAILAQALGQPHAILDGNVKRVLCRLSGEREWPGRPAVERRLWAEAQARLPVERVADYTQALMDFGATHCTPRRPRCAECPFRAECGAHRAGDVDAIPARKPSKPMPQRQAHLLVIRDAEGRVLLEKREGKGVWRGLWSLPEAPDDEASLALGEALGLPGPGTALPPFIHVFSHYRLEARPRLLEAGNLPLPELPGRRWIGPADHDALGLPRPIRTLLESLK